MTRPRYYDLSLDRWVETDYEEPIDDPRPRDEPDPELETARQRWEEWECYRRRLSRP
jgi:hypothetical protein